MPPKAAKIAAQDPLAASQADQEVEELEPDTPVSTAPAAKSAARGAPLLAPFRGFSDDMTTDEFLYLFELSADGLDEKTTKTELVRCLAPDLILSLLKAGFNMKSKSSTEIVEQLKTSFSRPRRPVPQARAQLASLKLKPGQGVQAFVIEMIELAAEAQETHAPRLLQILFEALPTTVKMLIGLPKADDTLADYSARADAMHSISIAYPESPVPQIMNVGGAHPVPKHGRNRGRSPRRNRPPSPARRRSATPGAKPGKFAGECWNCHKLGHRASECRSPQEGSNVVGAVQGTALRQAVVIEGSTVDLLVDTGSSRSFVKLAALSSSARKTIVPCNKHSLPTANGSSLHIIGTVRGLLRLGDVESVLTLWVCPDLSPAGILGMDDLVDLDVAVICSPRGTSLDPLEPEVVNAVEQEDEAPSEELRKLLDSYQDIFSSAQRVSTLAKCEPHHIKLKEDSAPPFIDHHGPILNAADSTLVAQQVETWLATGVIRTCKSPHKTYLLVASNAKGKKRVCPALLALNRATIFSPHPVPLLDEVRRRIGDAKLFSVIDLTSAFSSMPLAPESQELTAFKVEDTTYCFTRVQWGLLNAGTTFQRYIEKVLDGIKGTFVYIDDILVFADDEAAMLRTIKLVLERLQAENLLVNTTKSRFVKKEVTYLGNVLSRGKISPDPARIEAISSWSFPATVSEMKSFVGAATFVSEFVPDFGLIKGLLHPLLSSKKAYLPTERQRQAFEELKVIIKAAVGLHQPVQGQAYYLRTDASSVGLGAFLYQVIDGETRVLYYLSRVLDDTESRYPAQKLELLAMKWSCSVLRSWLLGASKLVIITDHKGLLSCLEQPQANATLQRWASAISEYSPELQYRPGSSNHMADFLSRHPNLGSLDKDAEELGDSQEESRRVKKFISAAQAATPACVVAEVDSPWLQHDKLLDLQQKDAFCSTVFSALKKPDTLRGLESKHGFSFRRETATGVLLAFTRQQELIVAPAAIVKDILHRLHDRRGHFRLSKTLASAKSEFFWPGLVHDVKEYLNNCVPCAQRGTQAPVPLPMGSLLSDEPNSLVSTDIMGPFPETERKMNYVVTFTCHFSKFNISRAIPDLLASTVVRCFADNWVGVFGAPRRVLSDNGTQYTSQLFEDFCKSNNIEHIKSTPYNPQGNGVAERINRTLMSALSKICEDVTDWEDQLHSAVFAHNSSISASTQETPYLLMFGRHPARLVELPGLQSPDATESTVKVQSMNKERLANLRVQDVKLPFQPGDIVLVHNPVIPRGQGGRRLHLPYLRTRMVKSVSAPNTLHVRDSLGNISKIHARRAKKAPPLLCKQFTAIMVPEPQDTPPPKPAVPKPTAKATLKDTVLTTRSGRVVKKKVVFKC